MNFSLAARRFVAPTLALSLVFVVYGLITVFWQRPTLDFAAVLMSIYFLCMGGASFLNSRAASTVAYEGDSRRADASLQDAPVGVNIGSVGQLWRSLAMIQLAGGVLLLVVPHTELWMTLIGSIILGLTGVALLLMGLRVKNVLPTDKDWRIAGFVTVMSALGLTVLSDLGAKAMLGVTAGGALIAGIFMVIGAISLRGQSKNHR
ncbi:hypothetical protein [Rothia sp. ZJ932]|uniref:hypothetical protein n=1 Tax=Rothia sp. ZJ932 TaxID=2810516 RepID=UPI001966D075|nr:hypothetical protein [Rothia sp. ZJ932]QRZ61651.1 hypothetical protein JR346_00415 [Rothia sp. ZJ932]